MSDKERSFKDQLKLKMQNRWINSDHTLWDWYEEAVKDWHLDTNYAEIYGNIPQLYVVLDLKYLLEE